MTGHGSGRLRALGVVLTAGVAVWLLHTQAATPVFALAERCLVLVDERPISEASSSSPIPVPIGGGFLVEASAAGAEIERVDLELRFGPFPVASWPEETPRATTWSQRFEVGQYARYGAGLYEVAGTVDNCSVSAWVFVDSPSPLTTVASLAAFVALGLGSVAGGAGLLSAIRGGGGLIRSVIGGMLVGASALVLAQQTGVAPVDNSNIAIWTGVPGAAGGAGNILLGGFIAPRIRRRPTPGEYAEPPTYADAHTYAEPQTHAEAPPTTTRAEPAIPAAEPGATEATTEFPLPAAEPSPPRETYAHLACPEIVVAEVEFELAVGLAATPDAAIVGGPLIVPDSVIGAYTMTIQVVADGFRLTRPSETWRVDLRVTGADPYPEAVIHLAADPQARPVVARTIRAMYSVDGQAIGLAARPIAVVGEPRLLAETQPPPAAEPLDILLPTDQAPPDLTVRIEVSQPPGRLLLQLLAADPAVSLPDDALVVDIGNQPDLFLRDIITKMNAVEGQPGMYSRLLGIGLTIADELPSAFWDAVAAVAARIGGPPTILFLSDEPYVPWELAVMEQPLDDSQPPFLCAQAAVGRWILGQKYPKLPPPSELNVSSIGVVSGIYQLPGWQRLFDAEEEANQLAGAFGAAKVDANAQALVSLLSGEPPAEVMHFAVHGQYDPNGEIDGLVLADGATLDEMQVKGSRLGSRPFVFLNACQVGSGNAVLGNYAGLAQAFLYAGASGVIAPLWSIDDVAARELAIRFYTQARAGKTPAEILREERASFQNEPNADSSTYLAYQFFGHPHLKLKWADTPMEG